MDNQNRHAIVIGGGISGLLTAQVLSNYFEHVTIIERDQLPNEPIDRKGTPQSRHTHFILMRGKMIFDQLFPDLMRKLTESGAVTIDLSADVMWLAHTTWYPRFHSGLETVSCSRNLLEWAIRQELKNHRAIQFQEATQAVGLLMDKQTNQVVGVRTRPSHCFDDERSEAKLYAKFVVDASGRSSQTLQWLRSFGYPEPSTTIVKPFVGYTTRYYTCPEHTLPDWKILLMPNTPPDNNRSAALLKVENNRWFLTMSSVGGDYPPADEEGFQDFARQLPHPYLYDFIKTLTPISPIYTFQIPQNRFLHYEKMDRWPEQFVVLGDAICTFNPIYSQGMTAGAEGVIVLDKCFREHSQRKSVQNLHGFSRFFQQQLARVISTPWLLAAGEDGRYPTTQGSEHHILAQLMRWYMDGVIRYATENMQAYQTLLEVFHLITSPSALFQPNIMINALACNVEALT